VVGVVGVPVVVGVLWVAAVSAVSFEASPPQATSAALATPIVKTRLRVMEFTFIALRSSMVPPVSHSLHRTTAPRHDSLMSFGTPRLRRCPVTPL
jgi:hypothetical protein